jgi:hypothetical protein
MNYKRRSPGHGGRTGASGFRLGGTCDGGETRHATNLSTPSGVQISHFASGVGDLWLCPFGNVVSLLRCELIAAAVLPPFVTLLSVTSREDFYGGTEGKLGLGRAFFLWETILVHHPPRHLVQQPRPILFAKRKHFVAQFIDIGFLNETADLLEFGF